MNKKPDFGVWYLVCAAALCYPAFGSAQTSAQTAQLQHQVSLLAFMDCFRVRSINTSG